MAYQKDISAVLGLSISAVSKALNGYPDISEETRKKVLQTAEELDYNCIRFGKRQPGRQLWGTVGILAPGSENLVKSPYYRELLCGMTGEAARNQRDLVIMGDEFAEEMDRMLLPYEDRLRQVFRERLVLDQYHEEFPHLGIPAQEERVERPFVAIFDGGDEFTVRKGFVFSRKAHKRSVLVFRKNNQKISFSHPSRLISSARRGLGSLRFLCPGG